MLQGVHAVPLIFLFEQDRADETGDGRFVWKDADDVGASLDFTVQTFERIRRMQLRAMLLRKAHTGENVVLGLVHQRRELRHLGPELIGDETTRRSLRPAWAGIMLVK